MRFFSFSKEEIHPPPQEKIIPAQDFSTLIEASQILEKAKEESVLIKENSLKECEILMEEAKQKGFNQGLEKLNEHILMMDSAIQTLNEKYEKQVLPIAVKAAKKILAAELKTDPEAIVNIIKGALKPVSQHLRIKIFVNRQDLDILEKNKPRIKEILDQVQTFSLEERNDIEPGGCIIETEKGIINAQLENQFRAIEDAFKAFTQNK